MYAGSEKLTVFMETIAQWREVSGLRDRIHAATDEDQPDNPDEPAWENELGIVPPGYFQRVLAEAAVDRDAVFVDVDHPATHGVLNTELGDLLHRLGVAAQYDRGVVMTQDRRVTRPIARFLYERYAGAAAGIRYESRLAAGHECWALWPTAAKHLSGIEVTPLSPNDSALTAAADLIGVKLPSLDDIEPLEWADRRW